MTKNIKTPDNVSGYGEEAYKYIISDKMNVLRSRLLNLADGIATSREQANSIKGLIKDFCGDAFYPMLREVEDYLRFFNVLSGYSGSGEQLLKDVERID